MQIKNKRHGMPLSIPSLEICGDCAQPSLLIHYRTGLIQKGFTHQVTVHIPPLIPQEIRRVYIIGFAYRYNPHITFLTETRGDDKLSALHRIRANNRAFQVTENHSETKYSCIRSTLRPKISRIIRL